MSGEVLIIYNVSRYCGDEYECTAFNGVPPAVSRKIIVDVQCESLIQLLARNSHVVKTGIYLLHVLAFAITLFCTGLSNKFGK
jgi:hypothetical protein